MGNLKWETPSERDAFRNDLSNKLGGIPCYDKNVTHGEGMEENPQSRIDVRPEHRKDADELFEFIKERMKKIPALTGRITWHDCNHDSGVPFRPCEIEGSFEV